MQNKKFIFLISTHCKPKCQKFCIDNIFVKNTKSITKSGTIETDISHHKSVFLVSEYELTEKQNNEQRTYLSKSVQNSIFLNNTTCEEVISIISEFQNTKSSEIPIKVIKHIRNAIAPYLCKLYNSCISLGSFPSCLKIGRIIPVYKKGSKNGVSNYRPVSALPIFGKIFEKILYSRLYSFFY